MTFNWACDAAAAVAAAMLLQVEYRLLAEGRLLKGDGADVGSAAAVRGMSSEGRGKSEKTISAKESMLAERCSALLSLRLLVREKRERGE